MRFDFEKNWGQYSAHALDPERFRQPQDDFARLLTAASGVSDKSFLNSFGFGQGLSLLCAAGGHVFGIDINPTCAEVLKRSQRFFPSVEDMNLPVAVGSILDEKVVQRIHEASPRRDGYDVVHSWGVLHHTGNMRLAIQNAAALVKSRGYLVVAIYKGHWSSRLWLAINYIYCKSPPAVRSSLVSVLLPIVYAGKWLVTKEDPRKQARGMDFYCDVVDWVGGYAYEFASVDEIKCGCYSQGFSPVHIVQARVPTGCDEFVFREQAPKDESPSQNADGWS